SLVFEDDLHPAHLLIPENAVIRIVKQEHAEPVGLEHILPGQMEICLCPTRRSGTARERHATEKNAKSPDHRLFNTPSCSRVSLPHTSVFRTPRPPPGFRRPSL